MVKHIKNKSGHGRLNNQYSIKHAELSIHIKDVSSKLNKFELLLKCFSIMGAYKVDKDEGGGGGPSRNLPPGIQIAPKFLKIED